MDAPQKLAIGLSGFVVVGLVALAAGPAIVNGFAVSPEPTPPVVVSSLEALPTPPAKPAGADQAVNREGATSAPSCAALATVTTSGEPGNLSWVTTGKPKDTGSAEGASGTVDAALTQYTVAAGDTLEQIGDRFCMQFTNLATINKIDDWIHPGDVLTLVPVGNANDYFEPAPTPGRAFTTSNGVTVSYTVAAGDTAQSIEHRFGVELDEQYDRHLQAGEVISLLPTPRLP